MDQVETVPQGTQQEKPLASLDFLTLGDWRLTATERPLSVAEQIAERISSDILNGLYQPGERIIEQSIADTFQVSRGPVRDAIRILEKEGVVEILPRRGAQVTSLSIKEVDDIFAIRAALIALAVSLAVPVLTDEEAAQVQTWIEQMATSYAGGGSTEEYVPISYQISLYISKRCQNERLYEMIRSMSRQTLRYSHLGLASPERRAQSVSIWKELSHALNSRNAEKAGELTRRLIVESGKSAKEQLQKTNRTQHIKKEVI